MCVCYMFTYIYTMKEKMFRKPSMVYKLKPIIGSCSPPISSDEKWDVLSPEGWLMTTLEGDGRPSGFVYSMYDV